MADNDRYQLPIQLTMHHYMNCADYMRDCFRWGNDKSD